MPRFVPMWRHIMPPGPTKARYSTLEVADMLGVDRDLVTHWCRTGLLRARRHWTKGWRVDPDEYRYEIRLRAVELALERPEVQADLWRAKMRKEQR